MRELIKLRETAGFNISLVQAEIQKWQEKLALAKRRERSDLMRAAHLEIQKLKEKISLEESAIELFQPQIEQLERTLEPIKTIEAELVSAETTFKVNTMSILIPEHGITTSGRESVSKIVNALLSRLEELTSNPIGIDEAEIIDRLSSAINQLTSASQNF